jgi:hypothetical protein
MDHLDAGRLDLDTANHIASVVVPVGGLRGFAGEFLVAEEFQTPTFHGLERETSFGHPPFHRLKSGYSEVRLLIC